MRKRFVFLLALIFCASSVFAKDVEEKFDDGTVHLRYQVDAKDRKSGTYQELYPGGKPHVKGTYTADKKTGTWTTFNEAGKVQEIADYRNDQLDGPYQYNYPAGTVQMRGTYRAGSLTGQINTFDEKGNPLFSLSYPIAFDAVTKAYKTWSPATRSGPKMLEEPSAKPPQRAGRMANESQQAALKYMMLYRFLSGVTVNNMGIDSDYADKAQHGAVVLADIGKLSHTPEKPDDMDTGFYKTGYAGTSSSNISEGRDNLFDSIDDYMNDSDESNVARVGHRQWILMPAMQKTAFGYCDRFSTLYAFDGMKHPDMNWTFIAYPGPGYYPHSMLRDNTAWSVSLNNQKCKVGLPDTIEIKVSALDEHFAVTDTSTATIVAIPQSPNSVWPCIVFRPEIKTPGVGKFVVQINGIKTTTGAPAPLTYLVDVIDMPKADSKPDSDK